MRCTRGESAGRPAGGRAVKRGVALSVRSLQLLVELEDEEALMPARQSSHSASRQRSLQLLVELEDAEALADPPELGDVLGDLLDGLNLLSEQIAFNEV